MHGDLISLDESAPIINNLSNQFHGVDGVLVLDKSQFCIGGERSLCFYPNALSDSITASGSLKQSDASVVAELTDNVCTTFNNVYKIHLSDNRGYVLDLLLYTAILNLLSYLYLLNNQRITLAILKSQ